MKPSPCLHPACASQQDPTIAAHGRWCAACGRPVAGARLGAGERFVVEAYLASGYVADIFAVRNVATNSRYVAKLYGRDETKRFFAAREVAAHTQLVHPRIPALIDAFADDPWYCVVMELAGGTELRRHVEAAGPLSVAAAVKLGRDLCDVLDAVTANGWTYRDLHPRNIMVGGARGAVIVDFDGARPPGWPPEPRGRFGYRAPELEESGEVTPVCDVYSLAGCLYFALTREDPPLTSGPMPRLLGPLARHPRLARLLDACRDARPHRRPAIESLSQAFGAVTWIAGDSCPRSDC